MLINPICVMQMLAKELGVSVPTYTAANDPLHSAQCNAPVGHACLHNPDSQSQQGLGWYG